MLQYEKVEQLTDSLKKYVNINYELINLETSERSASIVARLISDIIVGQVAIFFVLFVSLYLGFCISEYIGNTYAGFGIVALFYLVLGVVLVFIRKKTIEVPICNNIIKKIYTDNQ